MLETRQLLSCCQYSRNLKPNIHLGQYLNLKQCLGSILATSVTDPTLLEGWCVCQNFRKDPLESKRPMLMDFIAISEKFYSFGPRSGFSLIKSSETIH